MLAKLVVGVAPAGRLKSIDVLRGLTILLMLLVNDIQPSSADGMTVAASSFRCFCLSLASPTFGNSTQSKSEAADSRAWALNRYSPCERQPVTDGRLVFRHLSEKQKLFLNWSGHEEFHARNFLSGHFWVVTRSECRFP